MDARTIVLVFAVIGLIAWIVRLRFVGFVADGRLDRASHERIAQRLEGIQDRTRGENHRPSVEGPQRGQETAMLGARRRLWRDTSTVLLLLGTAMIAILITTSGRSPDGAVLGIKATPGPNGSAGLVGTTTLPLASHIGNGSASPGRSPDDSVVATESPGPTPTSSTASESARPDTRPSSASTHPVSTSRPGSSDRLAVLTPCGSGTNCYVYVVRRGDNLVSIAHWFGIPYPTVLALNPHIREHTLQAGDRIILPPPRR